MLPTPAESIPIKTAGDVVVVRQAVRALAMKIGFSLVDQTRVVTAASELARNAFEHGGGGSATLEVQERGPKIGLRITFEDHGPGIPDVDLALKDGFTSGNGMGLGLGGSKRLVNEFHLHTAVGAGTRVTITKWK